MIPILLVLSIPAALVAMVYWGRSVERWDLRDGEGCPPWEMWNWRGES